MPCSNRCNSKAKSNRQEVTKQLKATLCRANHEADNSNSVHVLKTVPLTNNTIQVNFAY